LNTQKHINKTQNNGSASEHVSSETTVVSTEFLVQMVQQNKELVNQLLEERQQLLEERQKDKQQYAEILEYCKEPKHITNNQNHFNLNFFLNVTCKDALNMSDFIRDLEIQIEDVESVSRLGFVEGITQILVNRLKGLEIHQRPIHCTDVKRDVLYIKDDNRWEKDAENTKIKQVIETVEQRNCRIASCEMKPDFLYADESRMDKYMNLLREVNGGGSREKNHDKIIKNLSKTFAVERTAPSSSSDVASSVTI
jgi:hypothetical protein